MLTEDTLFGRVDKVQESIKLLREHEPPEGYYVAFSGGKDSTVMYDIVKRSGVKYDVHYHLSTVDPPELVYFVKEHYPEAWEGRTRPKYSMWQLILKNRMPPTRTMRYCCRVMKEAYGTRRTVVTGIRAEESPRRAKRQAYESSINGKKAYLHAILNWTSTDVWDYITARNIPHCSLYDEGFSRIGCVMCPFEGHAGRQRDMERWPKIAENYKKACNRAFEYWTANGKLYKEWESGEDMFNWWIGELSKPTIADSCNSIPLFSEDDGEGVL